MKYPEYIMETVRQRLGIEKGNTTKDDYINGLKENKVVEMYLSWKGIIGYGNMIINLIEDVYGVKLKESD